MLGMCVENAFDVLGIRGMLSMHQRGLGGRYESRGLGARITPTISYCSVIREMPIKKHNNPKLRCHKLCSSNEGFCVS